MNISFHFSQQINFSIRESFRSREISDKELSENQTIRTSVSDYLQVSPFSKLKSFVQRFKADSDSQFLSVEGKFSDTGRDPISQNPQLEHDLDLILRLVSKDDLEYERLKKNFRTKQDIPNQNQDRGGSSNQDLERTFADLAEYASIKEQGRTTQIQTRQIEARMDFQKIDGRWEYSKVRIQKGDPLILDLSGNGVSLTNVKNGARFDFTGDGKAEKVAWVQGDDALLFWDKNGNGLLDDGKELFGDQQGARHGFDDLKKHDSNKDGIISAQDKIFKSLRLYRDLNGNRKAERGEVETLEESGITSLSLRFEKPKVGQGRTPQTNTASMAFRGYSPSPEDNDFILSGKFTRNDGSVGLLGDFLLSFQNI